MLYRFFSIVLLSLSIIIFQSCDKLEGIEDFTGKIISDHTAAKFSLLNSSKIEAAKAKLHIAYGHTSHGSQITTGMSGLVNFKGSQFAYNNGGSNGALDLRDTPFSGASDLGNPNRTAWETTMERA